MADGDDGCTVGGPGAFGRGVPSAEQAAATRPAADAGRHSLAPPQRRDLAGRAARVRALVAGCPQLFIRWSRLGAWQRLLGLAQARGVELGLVLLDGWVDDPGAPQGGRGS